MSRMVARDPFARTELHSEIVYDRTCKWCGGFKTTSGGKQFCYRYRSESDGGRKSDIPGNFCSVTCMRAYHE